MRMCTGMPSQVNLSEETFITNFTSMFVFPSVHQYMTFQGHLMAEFLPTERTDMGLFLGVDKVVPEEALLLSEAHAADGAEEVLPGLVSLLVLVKCTLVVKALLTDFALVLVRSLRLMANIHVNHE